MSNLDDILAAALQIGASAVHLFEREPPMARVDRELRPLSFGTVSREQALLWVENLAGPIGWSDVEREGSGRIFSPGPNGIDFHGRFHRGEQGVGIVLFPVLHPPPMEQHLLPSALRHLGDLRGLVLLAGGIATGKSNLLASLVTWLGGAHSWRILVLEEEPILFSYRPDRSWITHWVIPQAFPDMATALRSAIAFDVEMVALDPLRGAAEIEGALDLAAAGKLVLATHEAEGGVVETVASLLRTLGQNGETERLAATLRLVACQTLLSRRDGKGVAVVYETLPAHPAVAAAIRDGAIASLGEFVQVGLEGGRRVDDAILALWKSGAVSLEEAFWHAREKERFLIQLEETVREDSQSER
ncbi:MAG: hypothetical protein AB7T14_04975 [Candidatus Methylacidiphilaceae bacterium]